MSGDSAKLRPDPLWQPTTAKWFAAVVGGSLVAGKREREKQTPAD